MDTISLTEREKTVLLYLGKGLKNSEISEKLNISVHTTKAHLEAMYEKLSVNNRLQAVIKAVTLGLMTLEDLV